MRNFIQFMCAGLLALVCGCTSFSSSMLNRLGDNSFVGNSNGNPTSRCRTRPFKGVPITLNVPSHLDVYIDESYYLQQERAKQDLKEIDIPRLLSVRAEVVKTKKVFIVDLKRPGSGSLNSSMTFNDQQYFDQITGTLSDTTIKDSASLLSTVLKAIPTPTAAKPTGAGGLQFMRRTRMVAFQRFDINDPDFELQVEVFVGTHLNDCNSCKSFDQVPAVQQCPPQAPPAPADQAPPASAEELLPAPKLIK